MRNTMMFCSMQCKQSATFSSKKTRGECEVKDSVCFSVRSVLIWRMVSWRTTRTVERKKSKGEPSKEADLHSSDSVVAVQGRAAVEVARPAASPPPGWSIRFSGCSPLPVTRANVPGAEVLYFS